MVATFWMMSLLAVDPGIGQEWLFQLREAEELRVQHLHADAVVRYEAALTEAEKLNPQGLPVGIVLNNSGYLYQQLGQTREAIRRYARALDIFERELSPGSRQVIEVAMNLSGAYLEANEVSRAESLLRRFLSLEKGLQSGDRAALLADLGSVLVKQGNPAEGERAFGEALGLFEKQPEDEFKQRTVVVLTNLAAVSVQLNRLQEAIGYLERGRTLLSTLAAAPPIMVIKTLANGAVISALAGRLGTAESLFVEATAVCENTFGPEHYLLGSVLRLYAQFLHTTNRGGDAKRVEKRAKAILGRFSRENAIGFTVDAKALMSFPRPDSR